MLNDYIDVKHEALIRYVDRTCINITGIQKAKRIFINIKNSVEYDNGTDIFQKASETLVMGSGNNFSKNALLCAVLRLYGFNCDVRYRYICDNTKKIVFRKKDIVPWFYVHVNYMGKDIELDCSLNRSFMSAARIRNTGKDFDYKMEHYYYSEGQAFKVISEEREIDDVNTIDKIFEWINDLSSKELKVNLVQDQYNLGYDVNGLRKDKRGE